MSTSNPARRRTLTAWLATTGALLLGFAAIVAGAVAVFVTVNGAGAAVLVGGGVVLVAVGALGERRPAAVAGAVTAPSPRAAAAASPAVVSAPSPRAAVPQSPERDQSRQAAVDRGRRLAKRPALRRADVAKLFESQNDGKRVMALAIIQRRPDLGSLAIVLGAVARPANDAEHHEGLLAAVSLVEAHALTAEELGTLRAELSRQLAEGTISGDDPRLLAEKLLDPGSPPSR